MKHRKFWLVKGSGPASVHHPSRVSAEAEAHRLARIHPGAPFAVMEAVTVFQKIDVERIDLDAEPADLDVDDTPF